MNCAELAPAGITRVGGVRTNGESAVYGEIFRPPGEGRSNVIVQVLTLSAAVRAVLSQVRDVTVGTTANGHDLPPARTDSVCALAIASGRINSSRLMWGIIHFNLERPSNIPIPDPTLLTTQQLTTTVMSLRELVEEKIDSLLRLHEQKFSGIATQFSERDIRATQTTEDQKKAVEAAFAAAKEAVAKSEISTKENLKALDEKVNDLRDRLTRLEGRDAGTSRAQEASHWNIGTIISLIALVLVVISMMYFRH